MARLLVLAALAVLMLQPARAGEPVRIIFDTDMGNDIDDALALATLHAFESRGEAKILAVTITKGNRWAPAFVDLFDTFYGRPQIPIGMVTNGKTPEDGNYNRQMAEKATEGGRPLYPHKLGPETRLPAAEEVLRRVLAAQPDSSVVIVQVGFSTNLARLLDTAPDQISSLSGRELVQRKVRQLVVMGGNFAAFTPEYNIMNDIPAARKLFADWPTEIAVSGWEIGGTTLYPARHIDADFRYSRHHPLADAYRLYQKMPYDEPLWDPTAALYAVRPRDGYFGLSQTGRITVDDQGRTVFNAGEGNRRILTVNDVQRGRIIETIATLASQPPDRCR